MNKILLVILIISGVIAAGIAGFAGWFYIADMSVKIATLSIEKGQVQVNPGSGWMMAEDGMNLKINDKIKTLADSTASIILYESDIFRLDPNTEVSLKEISSSKTTVRQESGSTWTKVASLSGARSYEVETPTTVATVRGTEFGIDADAEKADIFVSEGIVNAQSEQESVDVKSDEKIRKKIGQKIEKMRLDEKDIAKINANKLRDIERFKELRMEIISKHRNLLAAAKKSYKFEDKDIEDYLNKIDNEEVSEDEVISKLPIRTPSVEKAIKITREIKKLKKAMLKRQSNQ